MVQEYTVCNICGKAAPRYKRQGWYDITTLTNPICYRRVENVNSVEIVAKSNVHFCCGTCFMQYMQNIINDLDKFYKNRSKTKTK